MNGPVRLSEIWTGNPKPATGRYSFVGVISDLGWSIVASLPSAVLRSRHYRRSIRRFFQGAIYRLTGKPQVYASHFCIRCAPLRCKNAGGGGEEFCRNAPTGSARSALRREPGCFLPFLRAQRWSSQVDQEFAQAQIHSSPSESLDPRQARPTERAITEVKARIVKSEFLRIRKTFPTDQAGYSRIGLLSFLFRSIRGRLHGSLFPIPCRLDRNRDAGPTGATFVELRTRMFLAMATGESF